jgi:hypothetical protein
MAMITDTSARRDRNTAKTAQASEAIMSIRITDFVAAKSSNLTVDNIKVVFRLPLKKNKRGPELKAN